MALASDTDTVQVYHPIKKRWVKVSTRTGRIIAEKRTRGPFKGVPIKEPADAR